MIILTMSVSSGTNYINVPPLYPRFKTWEIRAVRSEDQRLGIAYPTDERILEIAKDYFPSGTDLQVVGRRETDQKVIVRLPPGIMSSCRFRFTQALGRETNPKA
jgi:hypothetical protein